MITPERPFFKQSFISVSVCLFFLFSTDTVYAKPYFMPENSAYSEQSLKFSTPYENPYYMISIGNSPKSMIIYTGNLEKRGEFGINNGYRVEISRYGTTYYFGSAFGTSTYSSSTLLFSYFKTNTQVLKDVSSDKYESIDVGTSADAGVLSYIPTLFIPWQPGGTRGPELRLGAGAGPGVQLMQGDAYVTTEVASQNIDNSEKINFGGIGVSFTLLVYTECRFSPHSSGVILRISLESSVGFDANYTYDTAQAALAIGYAF